MWITSDEIKKLMLDSGWASRRVQPYWMIYDHRFQLVTDDEVMEIVRVDSTNQLPYTDGGLQNGKVVRRQCEEFAFRLALQFLDQPKSLGVIAIDPHDGSEDHAIFFWINEQQELKALEPQTDRLYLKPFTLMAVTII